MGTVISFAKYKPGPRYFPDKSPWTQVRIEEATDPAAGPWTLIDTQTLSPLDTDPADPMWREVSTAMAVTTGRWYRLRWVDAAANLSAPTDPVKASGGEAIDGSSFIPSVAQIGKLMPYRTAGTEGSTIGLGIGGIGTGTFSTQTVPTATAVADIADNAADDVAADIGQEIPYDFLDLARRAAAIRAAYLIEVGYYPNATAQIEMWRDAYRDAIAQLEDAMRTDVGITSAGWDGTP
jgi:hypothetical protein